ncbi:hypothetical protein GZ212_13725 [Mangrovimonas sp. CR14]|uniref:hypothetical protein n=1 Tax=Mangrovimonas sp. CR14 TaxID=2706120 RepID=UPI00142366EA|nr:hypothetical protein [Mangrovimonas sp. CR14]NIK93217.1 hypothetical protein [Mangrovimonas sp. CR14]
MNREYHLSFCKICINRKPSLKEGLICSLTGKIAEFEKECANFKIDGLELEKIKKRFETEINDKYAITKLESLFSEREFEKPEKNRNRKYLTKEKTHGLEFKKDKNYDKQILVMIGIIMVMLLYGNYINGFSWDLNSANIIGVLIMLFLSLYYFYKAFYHKYKTLITIDENGIHQEEKTLYWNNILDYGIIRGKGNNSMEKKIIIGTISSGIQEINISELNVTPEEFIEIIQLNKKTIYKNI